MSNQYIVTFEMDDGCLTIPMTNDRDCKGALCCIGEGDPIVTFDTWKDANTAVRISKAYAKLCQAQGLPVNTDFLEPSKFIKIRKLGAWAAP